MTNKRHWPTAIILSLAALSLTACGATNASTGPAEAPAETQRGEVARANAAPTPALPEPSPTPQATPAQQQQSTPARAQEAAAPAAAGGEEARAEEVLKLAREALGGEAKLAEVQSFSVSGPFRRGGGEGQQQQSGEMRVEALAPDKLKVSETLDLMAGIQLTMIRGVNGAQSWVDSRSGADNAQVMMMRRDDKGKQDASAQADRLQSDLTRYLLAFLLTPPQGTSVSFSYAGEAEAPEGRADVLDVTGDHGFKARLFFDKKTHRPLMLSYRDVVRRAKTMKAAGGMGDVDKLVKRAQSEPPSAPRESDVQLYFSDFRAEKGLLLPHSLSTTVDGQPYEVWEVKEVKLNPHDLTPQKFEKGK